MSISVDVFFYFIIITPACHDGNKLGIQYYDIKLKRKPCRRNMWKTRKQTRPCMPPNNIEVMMMMIIIMNINIDNDDDDD